jgi:hypothetical protein
MARKRTMHWLWSYKAQTRQGTLFFMRIGITVSR